MEFESMIFDIDGTLWDSRAIVAEGYNAQLKEEGLEQFFVNPEILKGVFLLPHYYPKSFWGHSIGRVEERALFLVHLQWPKGFVVRSL